MQLAEVIKATPQLRIVAGAQCWLYQPFLERLQVAAHRLDLLEGSLKRRVTANHPLDSLELARQPVELGYCRRLSG